MDRVRVVIVIMVIVMFVGVFKPVEANAQQGRDYSDLLYSELENLSFSKWFAYLKQLAREYGVWIDDSDMQDLRVYYYDEGFYPHEVIDLEYR